MEGVYVYVINFVCIYGKFACIFSTYFDTVVNFKRAKLG